MALLRKLKSATLMEAIVATILVVVIFVVASLVLNNLLLNTFSGNTHQAQTRVNELAYEIQNKTLQFPYREACGRWDIQADKVSMSAAHTVIIISVTDNKGKEVLKRTIYAGQN